VGRYLKGKTKVDFTEARLQETVSGSALMLVVGQQEGQLACKKLSGGVLS